MPAVYVSGSLSIDVTLPDDEDNEFTFDQWTDKKLPKERKEYDRPNVGIELRLENEVDPICPFVLMVTENDAYEGEMKSIQNGRTFSFVLQGKFKANAHKDTKAQIDAGRQLKLNGVMINGQGYSLPERQPANLIIQSKKI